MVAETEVKLGDVEFFNIPQHGFVGVGCSQHYKSILSGPFPHLKSPSDIVLGKTGESMEPQQAHTFLEEAVSTMKDRAALRDTPGGERTAGKIAQVFNALTGHNITEADAWTFFIVMKLVRSRNGKYHRDDYIDMAAFSGLLGECESVDRAP